MLELLADGEVCDCGARGTGDGAGEGGVVAHLIKIISLTLRVVELGRHTEDMNSPNAPPSAKPITPDMMDFPTQDSIAPCI